jgi:hypothetical protein
MTGSERLAPTTLSTDPTLASLQTLLSHDGRFVRLVAQETTRTLGSDGTATLEAALRRFGTWLARTVAGRARCNPGSLPTLLQAWDVGDLAVGHETGWSAAVRDGDDLVLTLAGTPALRHFDESGTPALGRWFYTHLLNGISSWAASAPPMSGDDGPGLTFRWRGGAAGPLPEPTSGLADARLLLHTAQGRGALMGLVGQALLNEHGTTGEYCLRTAMSRFGAERGQLLRARVDAQGLEPDIATMIANYDSGGHTSVWQWADGGELTAGRQFQDCTFCPFIPVWRELDAMEIGRIYDYEFHVAQFRAFNPAIRLRWDALQTRGDNHCAFRFTLPGA